MLLYDVHLKPCRMQFYSLEVKKIMDSCCVELSHPFIYSHQILESLENAMFYITGCSVTVDTASIHNLQSKHRHIRKWNKGTEL